MRSYITILLFPIIFCVSVSVGGAKIQTFRCDYSRVLEADGWLKFHEMPSNWNEARLRCHMEGAVLASPLNEDLRNAMTATMVSKELKCAVFTGIHATFSKGDFASIEGTPLAKIPHTWAEGEPDNFQDKESCLVLLTDGTMGDASCTDTYPYFCYKKYTPTLFTSCGTTDLDYQLDHRTGSCYKFHKVPRTWSRAHMNCMAEGAHLAIINSEAEANVLKKLYEQNPGDSVLGNFEKNVAFVGFYDWTEHGDWRTIQGQTLEEAGYAKFLNGEPNNATTGEFCGGIFRNALYNDLPCEKQYAFICEKDPASLVCSDD